MLAQFNCFRRIRHARTSAPLVDKNYVNTAELKQMLQNDLLLG